MRRASSSKLEAEGAASTSTDKPLPHGGRLEEARRRFPDAPEPFVDLSTGINPHAYPLPVLPSEAFTRLPESEALAQLEATAAEAYGVANAACVVGAPGTQALIQLLPRLRSAEAVAVLGPTYNEHAHSWRLAGAAVREVTAFDDLASAEVAVLCNPNNPDGRRHDPVELQALAKSLNALGGLLVVDEAFADLEPEPLSLASELPLPGAIVLRSFGKTYGLAGLRLGFALSEPVVAEELRRMLGPWAVPGPSIAIGAHALADRTWLELARAQLSEEVSRLDALLRAAGLEVVGGTLLFRLAAGERAPALCERLGRAGILVRAFPFEPRWLRFGLPGDESAWERLAAALL